MKKKEIPFSMPYIDEQEIEEKEEAVKATGECVAIDPCELCSHGEYVRVDSRCKTCGLRGRRFFEVVHAAKKTA